MPTNRWFFNSVRNGKFGFTVDGDPGEESGFQGWVSVRKQARTKKVKLPSGKFEYKEPTILRDGLLYYGRLLTATKIEGAPCSTNCRRATQPVCSCSCFGKNHGIDNRDMASAIQEEDVIWRG